MARNQKLRPIVIIFGAILVASSFLQPLPTYKSAPIRPQPTPNQSVQTTPPISLPHSPSSHQNQSLASPAPSLNSAIGSGQAIVSFSSGGDLSHFLRQNHLSQADLKALPNLNSYLVPVAPEHLISSGAAIYPNLNYSASLTPNDPLVSSSWHLGTVAAPTAWDTTTGSNQTTVAVIDTGFALSHQDLSGRWQLNGGEMGATTQEGPAPNCTSRGLALDKSCNNLDNDGDGYASNWRGWDFVDSSNDPSTGKSNPTSTIAFHGTATAGVIAATGNNGVGVAGLNWQTQLIPLQALDDDGSGWTSDVASAIRYAADHGANVINLSLGATSGDSFLKQQIDYAINKGITVVAAAGNSGCNCISYPANYPEVIAVGATNQSGSLASFSNYGANLDLVAPGVNICSTSWSSSNQTSAYSCSLNGTSFATPIISGIVSLMLVRDPEANPDDIMRLLSNSTGASSFSQSTGYGLASASKAINNASLYQPQGELSNKQSISLAGTTSQNDGTMDTTCISIPGISCTLKLVGPSGQIITIGQQSLDDNGVTEFIWNANSAGLTAGTWQVQLIVSNAGQTTTQSTPLSVAN